MMGSGGVEEEDEHGERLEEEREGKKREEQRKQSG